MNIREYLEKKASFRRTPAPGNFTASTGRQRAYNYGYRAPSTGQQAMPPGRPRDHYKLEADRIMKEVRAKKAARLQAEAAQAVQVPKPKPSIGKKIGGFFRKLL